MEDQVHATTIQIRTYSVLFGMYMIIIVVFDIVILSSILYVSRHNFYLWHDGLNLAMIENVIQFSCIGF